MPEGVIACAQSPRGDVVLRRRERDGELELRVNGVFVMDTRETATERAIASLALDSIAPAGSSATPPPLTVLIGGLGLGYTLCELAASPLVAEIIVAEIEESLVDWHRDGLIPSTAETVRSPHVRIDPRDVRDVVGSQGDGSLDIIVLDVDNGPGFLVYDDNAAIYQCAFLTTCRETLTGDGAVVIWSSDVSPGLSKALAEVFGSVSHHVMAVSLEGRPESYHAYVARRQPDGDAACSAH